MSQSPERQVGATPDIVQIGAPVLRARAAEVTLDQLGSSTLVTLVTQMIETMRAAPGVGIAAPQIGVPLRVIVLEERPELLARVSPVERQEQERVAFGPRVLVNPVLHAIGDARATFFEGCLSVNGYQALVERSHEVLVTGYDEHGALQSWQVRGWPARILQHEVDHIDGTLYVDRMWTRSFSSVAEARARLSGKSIAEVRAELGV
jgi:peptide deformylase